MCVLPQEMSTRTSDSLMPPATWCVCPQRSLLLMLSSGATSTCGLQSLAQKSLRYTCTLIKPSAHKPSGAASPEPTDNQLRNTYIVLVPKSTRVRTQQGCLPQAHSGLPVTGSYFSPTSACSCPQSSQNPLWLQLHPTDNEAVMAD